MGPVLGLALLDQSSMAGLMHNIAKVKARHLNGICEKREVRRLGFMKPAQRLFSDEKQTDIVMVHSR